MQSVTGRYMKKANPANVHAALADALRQELTSDYGPMVSDDKLRMLLGYKTMAAFRQAVYRKTVPITVFSIKDRKGKFGLVRDVASWMADQIQHSAHETEPKHCSGNNEELKEVTNDVAH